MKNSNLIRINIDLVVFGSRDSNNKVKLLDRFQTTSVRNLEVTLESKFPIFKEQILKWRSHYKVQLEKSNEDLLQKEEIRTKIISLQLSDRKNS